MISRISIGQRQLFFLLTLIFSTIPSLHAQLGQKYTIASVVYVTDGKTGENALTKTLDWDFTEIFDSTYELDAYIQYKKKLLINKKLFKSVNITYNTGIAEAPVLPVYITVHLEESWTILPLPIYMYDDNLGMMTGLILDYKNVAGSLTDFKASYYYSGIKSELNLDWKDVRAGKFFLDFGFNQLWETVSAADSDGNKNLEYSYIQSTLDARMKIPLLTNFSYYAKPIVKFPYSYHFSQNDTDNSNSYYASTGIIPAYNQTIEWDSVNWIGNLRQGLNASLEHQMEYDFSRNKFVTWVDGIFTSFIYTPWFNYNSRVSAFYYYNDIRLNAGDRLRGVLDYKLSGPVGFFWNQSLPINVLTIRKVGQAQLVPFFDMGFVLQEDEKFSRDRMQYTAGLTLTLFPSFLPSFSANLEYGINLRDFSETEFRFSTALYF